MPGAFAPFSRGVGEEFCRAYTLVKRHEFEVSRRSVSAGRKHALDQRLWPWGRTTAWRHVTYVMAQAGIMEGPHRVPKGLRHGYAIHALNKGVQINLVSKWMGHSTLETTAIYANAVGEEQQAIAARMWS
jgi:site-specific recombinase XerD